MGAKAFTIHLPDRENDGPSPVVFDSPHSGILLPDHFRHACTRRDLEYLNDRHVEKLIAGVPARGVPVLEALISRTVIDLNRATDELDPATIHDGWAGPTRKTANVTGGFGIFPKYIRRPDRTLVAVFNDASKPDAAEFRKRVDLYYTPYYDALNGLMDRAAHANGCAVHFNMHSFRRAGGKDIILGNLRAQSCAYPVWDFTKDYFRAAGLSVADNDPFAGAALIRATGNPKKGRHAIQIEIARDLYMDQDTQAFDRTKAKRIQDVMNGFSIAVDTFARLHAADLRPSSP